MGGWRCRLRLLRPDQSRLQRGRDQPAPHTAQTQYNAGPLVPAGQPLLPGDLVFYGTPSNVHHVGLYIGAGKMVHAPTFGEPVQVSNYRWNGDDYLAASRPAVDSRV